MNSQKRTSVSSQKPEQILLMASQRLKERYPGMTLRSVAAKLNISPSYWSKILSGKKPISKSILSKVVKTLGLDTQQTAILQRSILRKIESDKLSSVTGLEVQQLGDSLTELENYENLGRKEFWILSEWFYIPILNLFQFSHFTPNPKSAAQFLAIKESESEKAFQRLTQQGLIKLSSNGYYSLTGKKIKFPTNRSFREVREYHHRMIQKAVYELLGNDSEERFEKRLITSLSISGSSEKMKEAKLILEESLYRVANLIADSAPADEIFQLNLQFFPLSAKK